MLYLVGVPIGNIDDITKRAFDTIESVETIIVENFSDAKRLLQQLEISGKDIHVYNDSNKKKVIGKIETLLKERDAVFISSAGMPGLSDPGPELVEVCRKNDVEVVPIPGPSAFSTLLSMSDVRNKHVTFVGFLPKKKSKIIKLFDTYIGKSNAMICFESPFRVKKLFELLTENNLDYGVIIGREMTKKFEQYEYGNVYEILEKLANDDIPSKGEFSILFYQINDSVE